MDIIKGGVTAPTGFLATGVRADIKGNGGTKKDVAILLSAVDCAVAGVYTTSVVKAAPVILSQERTAAGSLRAVVINSGNANACTGEQGMQDTIAMAEMTARALGLKTEAVAVASTGVIGVPLPMDRVASGIALAAGTLSTDGADAATEAIMTTDTFPKQYAVRFELGGVLVTIGAMAKGSGMIHPNMATMLGFVTTDADVAPPALHAALKAATEKSFNMITVDGDTSTNDMVLAMANGMANSPKVVLGSPLYQEFAAALERVLTFLAKEIARDGEGATKLIEVRVRGAATPEDARKAARTVCGSSLVKAAVFGEDANWGRVLAALGYSGAQFDPNQVDLWLGDVQMMAAGAGLAFDEEAAAQVLKAKEVVFAAHLNAGMAEATAWGCDLTYDYVRINGSYRT